MRDHVDIVKSPPTKPVDELARPWTLIARVHEVPYNRGIAAMVEDEMVAIFRVAASPSSDDWYAISHLDPVTKAPVMARGLIGSAGDDSEIPTIASPLHKRRYDLRTGTCLDDQTPPLPTYDVQVIDGWVMIP